MLLRTVGILLVLAVMMPLPGLAADAFVIVNQPGTFGMTVEQFQTQYYAYLADL